MKKWIFTQAARKAFASILLLRVALLRRRSSAGARPFQPRGWGFPAAFGVRRARRGPALRHGGGTARRGSRSHPALPRGPLCSTPAQLLERAKPGQNPRDTRVWAARKLKLKLRAATDKPGALVCGCALQNRRDRICQESQRPEGLLGLRDPPELRPGRGALDSGFLPADGEDADAHGELRGVGTAGGAAFPDQQFSLLRPTSQSVRGQALRGGCAAALGWGFLMVSCCLLF